MVTESEAFHQAVSQGLGRPNLGQSTIFVAPICREKAHCGFVGGSPHRDFSNSVMAVQLRIYKCNAKEVLHGT